MSESVTENSVKPKEQSRSETAVRWLGVLGLVGAMAAVLLVPVFLDLDLLSRDPQEAYNLPKLQVLLASSAVMLVAVLGILVLGGRPVLVPVLIPTLAFLGISAASAAFSDNPYFTLFGDRDEGLLSLAAGVVLFYGLARCPTTWRRVRLFLAAAVTAAVAVSAHGIAQNFGVDLISGWGRPPFDDLGRPFSTTGNALTLAAYLTLMMGSAAALYMGAASKTGRVVWYVALAAIGACWISTESRGALLAAGVALPVILWLSRRKMGTIQPLLVPISAALVGMAAVVAVSKVLGFTTLSVPVVAALAVYLVLIAGFAWLTRSGTTRSLILALTIAVVLAAAAVGAAVATGSLASLDAATGRQGSQVSTELRLLIWRDTVSMILDRPLLGYGPDNFQTPFEPFVSSELEKAAAGPDGGNVIVDRAHNDFLQTAASTGLLGLAAYLWLLVAFFFNAFRRGGWILIALSGSALAYVIALQTAFPSLVSNVAFWITLGVSVAAMRLQTDPSAAPRPETPSLPPKRNPYEPIVVVSALVLLAAVAVPSSLHQRRQAAQLEQEALAANVKGTVEIYDLAANAGAPYPEAGTYSRANPLKGPFPGVKLRPPEDVEITTTTPPPGGFTVKGESTTLAGTFRQSYDSNTGEYTPKS